jgi:tape measure domain-containing protein
MRSKMLAATGDAAIAADAFAFVSEESDRLGLSIQTTANGFSGFAASALRAGLTLQQTKDIFRGVSEASVSMRLPAEQTALVFKALEQIAGKGTVSMEELRGQLGDALPGAFEIAAKAMGKSTAEFSKMVANGEVLAGDFLPRFGEAIRKELGGSVEEAAQGAQAAFNRLGNAFFSLQTRLASSGLLDVVVKAVNDLTAALNNPELVSGLGTLITMLAKIAEFALKVAGTVGNMVSAIKRTTESLSNSVFGVVFGEEGKKAIEAARAEANKTSAAASSVSTGTVSGNYTLGTKAVALPSPGQASAAKKAQQLREQLASQVESMRYQFASPEQQASMDVEKQQETLRKALEAKAITEQEFRELSLQAEMDYQERLAEIRGKARDDELSALEGFLGAKIESEETIRQRSISDQAKNFRETISQAASHNRAFFALEKAAAIARALISARESVVSAYAFGSRIGGPPLGAVFAGVAAAAQAANIAAIASTSFTGGGSSVGSGGGGGGTSTGSDSQDTTSTSAVTPEKNVYISLYGRGYTKSDMRDLIDGLNEAMADGSKLKIIGVNA